MTGALAWAEVGILAPRSRGKEPAGRRGAASRHRSAPVFVAFALGAAAAGALLGLLRQPDPQDQLDSFAWASAAAVESARHARDRAEAAERALAEARAKLEALSQAGLAEELADAREADRLGVSRFMKDSAALWGDERARVGAAIVRESRRNGLDPVLVAAVIQIESSFNPFAVSSAGARGLMQLMPQTARWLLDKSSSSSGLRPSHLFDPVLNVALGTAYLAQLIDRFGGDLTQALIAYNAGPSVARSLVRGSRAWQRRALYPKAVLATYRSLLLPPQRLAAR